MFLGMNSVDAAKLAKREELRRQLLTVDTEMNQMLLHGMYSSILNNSGREVHFLEIVMIFEKARLELMTLLIQNGHEIVRQAPFFIRVNRLVSRWSPQLILAILPNNRVEAAQAIAAYNEIHGLSEFQVLKEKCDEVSIDISQDLSESGAPEGKSDL